MAEEESEYITAEEVQALLGIKRSTLDSYVRSGKLTRYQQRAPSKLTLFKRSAVKALQKVDIKPPTKPRKKKP